MNPFTSTETTALALDTSNLFYVTQTEIYNTITTLLANFDDKHAKQDAKFKKSVMTIITNQDAKDDEKSEKHLQPLSLQIKDILSNRLNKTSYYLH